MQGKTPLIFASETEVAGVIAVADVVKPTSRQAIEKFKKMGLEVIMLTGDNAKTANAIKQQLNIDTVIAEVLPQDKENEIMKLRDEGIAFENEEYIKGIVAFAVPIKSYREDLQAAIWVVGVKEQVPEDKWSEISQFIRKVADELNSRFV